MKTLALSIILSLISFNAVCQNTIKFLGIPVEGTKKQMIAELENKGYEYDSYTDMLTGEFNGKDVNISVQTVNNRVWRIGIIDERSTDESNIKIRFNNLYDQFLNNGKYTVAFGSQIADKDDISYEITVNNKRYEASFVLKDPSINGIVWYMISEHLGSYRIIMFYENRDNAANGDDL